MIEVKNLVKRYGGVTAVSDLSFTIEKGSIYGFLGPNGAGKSTTMNILTGCLGATEGTVLIDGHDIFEEPLAAKKLIGYLPEQPPLYQDMTAREYLLFVLEAKGVAKKDWPAQLSSVMQKTQIEPVQHRLLRNLSKGYRQRVGIAQALLGDPEVIILDEPTVGLDPAQIIEIRDLIRELGQTHTVILSSHILSEVSAICDNILIIAKGKLVAADTPDNLARLFAGSSTLTMEVGATEQECRDILSAHMGLGEYHYQPLGEGAIRVTLTQEGETDPRDELFFAFADARKPIREMTHSRASLEDIFLELTQDKPDDAPVKKRRDKKQPEPVQAAQAEPAPQAQPQPEKEEENA